MAYVYDLDLIRNKMGNISTFQIMLKEFNSKVQLADFGDGVVCNIKYIDLLTFNYKRQKPDIGIGVGFVILDSGLMICFHYEFKIYYVGIANIDIRGWTLRRAGDDWVLWIFTYTNDMDQIPPIQFYVKTKNLPKVSEYFKKYGFKELG